jgi:hypothetical protein
MALIAVALGLAVVWLWVIYELAVAGRAFSLDAREWLRGGRTSPLTFFLIAPILAVLIGRMGYACVTVGPSDQASGLLPEETVDDQELI